MIMFTCPECKKIFDAPGVDPYLWTNCPACGHEWPCPAGAVRLDVATSRPADNDAAPAAAAAPAPQAADSPAEAPAAPAEPASEPADAKPRSTAKTQDKPTGRMLWPGMGRVLPTAGPTGQSRSASTLDKLLSVRPAAATTPPADNAPNTVEPASTKPATVEPAVAPVSMPAAAPVQPAPAPVRQVAAPSRVVVPAKAPTVKAAGPAAPFGPLVDGKDRSGGGKLIGFAASVFILLGVGGVIAGLWGNLPAAIGGAAFTVAAIVLLVIDRGRQRNRRGR